MSNKLEQFLHAVIHARFEANPTDHVANTRDLRAALARIAELEAERTQTKRLLHELAMTIIRAGVPAATNWAVLLTNLREFFKSRCPPPESCDHIAVTVPTHLTVKT